MSSVISTRPQRGLAGEDTRVDGEFLDRSGERYYVIRNVDNMAPFLVSVISSDNHWLFVSSTGGLTAGRVSPETALFPYVCVDKIHDSWVHTGPRTIIRARHAGADHYWEPFNREHRGRYSVHRNLYKNTLGSKLCFEEVNNDLGLTFRYTWSTSAEFGFVRDCELENTGSGTVHLEIIDGLQNILPAGTPRFTQTNSSNLVDAYKWTELDEETGLVFLTLYSGITDRAEPCESLRATTAYCLGLDQPTVLVSTGQLDAFRDGREPLQERHKRGIRGAYFVAHSLEIPANATSCWRIVLDAEQSQADVVHLRQTLKSGQQLDDAISASIAAGSDRLARIMASADAFQATAEENVAVHHYANVLFNVLRGGIVADQYNVSARDFRRTIRNFNTPIYERNLELLGSLPERLRFDQLLACVRESNDMQLVRLTLEYLPITFGRRHGDPSRPWNEFAIRLKDDSGKELLSYQGNWRDIFQNWEALAFSYPEFIENMIAKFVNASTADGYNPYRITKEGIDWEVEEPDNPWSYIGYWGDHQIIYLVKLLELSHNFHPQKLRELLHEPVFCYANVPYRIKPLEQLFDNPKDTVTFDEKLADAIDERVAAIGADGKLLLDAAGEVYRVNLLEKLVVPLLAKLGNLVVDGGIWLNTQRPEWNDANNALVGQGLSMVTLYYMRRYVCFLQDLVEGETGAFAVSGDVDRWLGDTASALASLRAELGENPASDETRYRFLRSVGSAASDFRERLYRHGSLGDSKERDLEDLRGLLDDALRIIDHSIDTNKREDGLYHAYNIAGLGNEAVSVNHLYPMLEGQVAVLSAGSIDADEVAEVIDALFASPIYRADQNSFMLYPDRRLPGFLQRNQVPEDRVQAIPLLKEMVEHNDDRIVLRDDEGSLRFNADFTNGSDVKKALDALAQELEVAVTADRRAILELYEDVFRHSEFTGRSGTMFGFEGLGSIYWHMVAKLLLALAENYFAALDKHVPADALLRLGDLYYRVRSGIGFNKTPAEYGAFPTDPYSHTPKHSGARQPGMTGQVKEEVLTRFAELGIQVRDGQATIAPALLRAREFGRNARPFCYLDVAGTWQDVDLPEASLAFTWCQVPFIYILGNSNEHDMTVEFNDGTRSSFRDLTLPADVSASLFARSGKIRKVTVALSAESLLGE